MCFKPRVAEIAMNYCSGIRRSLCISCGTKVKDVLSPENRQRTINALKSLKTKSAVKQVSKRRAAVLVPLCQSNGELSLLFTTRAMKLRNNRGQVAFPGGMEDPDDKTLERTVLRETHEEIGIEASSVDIWGAGPSVGREDMIVTPFLGYVGDIDPELLETNSEEVEKAFTASLSTLCDPKHFRTTHFRSRHGQYILPVFVAPTFRMWGLTALITHTILVALLPGQYTNKVPRHLLTSTNLPSVVFAASFLTLPHWELGF